MSDHKRRLNDVIDEMGLGLAQVKAILLGGSVYLADGAELLLIGAVTSVVDKEWKLSAIQRGMMVSIVFFGAMIGNFISGKVGDDYGRRTPILASYLGVMIFSFISALAEGYYMMLLLRCLVGISFGVGVPSWNAMSGEVAPSTMRTVMNGCGQIMFAVGETYSAFLLWFDDPQLVDLHWRWLVVAGALPAAAFFVMAYFWLNESPHFLAVSDRHLEADAVLRDMAASNNKENFDCSYVPHVHQQTEESWVQHIRFIFGRKLWYSTITVCFSTFTLNFMYYGMLYALPQVLPEVDLLFPPAVNLLIGAAWEIPGFIFGSWLGMHLSRKWSIILYLVGMFCSNLVFVLAVRTPGIPVLVGQHLAQAAVYANKLFVSVGWIFTYLYSYEIYPTVLRVTGTAICIASGRFGSMLCPLLYEFLDTMTGTFVYYFGLMCISCIVNIILVLMLPYETKDKPLMEFTDEYEAEGATA